MPIYTYNKSPVAIDSLTIEINQISGLEAYEYSTFNEPDELIVTFSSELSAPQKSSLDAIVSAHAGQPIYEEEGYLVVANGQGGMNFVPLSTTTSGAVTENNFDQYVNNYIVSPSNNALLTTISGQVEDILANSGSGTGSIYGEGYMYTEVEGETNTNRNYYVSYGQNDPEDIDEHENDKRPWLGTGYLEKARLDVPAVPAGTYKIAWYYEWRRNTTSSDFMGTVSIDDITVMEHRQEPEDVNSWHNISGFKVVTLPEPGSHVVSLAYCGDAGGNRVSYIRKARLEFWRIS